MPSTSPRPRRPWHQRAASHQPCRVPRWWCRPGCRATPCRRLPRWRFCRLCPSLPRPLAARVLWQPPTQPNHPQHPLPPPSRHRPARCRRPLRCRHPSPLRSCKMSQNRSPPAPRRLQPRRPGGSTPPMPSHAGTCVPLKKLKETTRLALPLLPPRSRPPAILREPSCLRRLNVATRSKCWPAT